MMKIAILAVMIASCMAVGGFISQQVITAHHLELAQWAASAMSTNEVHSVVAIKNMRTQVVSGMNYKFTLELSVNGVVSKSCEMSIYEQTWTQTRKMNEKPECSAMATATSGGFTDAAVTDEIIVLAKWAASTMGSEKETHSVMTVKKVQTQIVAGTNYKITFDSRVAVRAPTGLGLHLENRECNVTVFVQTWTNTQMVTAAQCSVVPTIVASRANGAFFDVEVTDEITGLAQWAASSIAAEKETHKVTSVKSAQSQIVNGINYKIDFVSRVAIKSSSMLGLYIEDRECSIEIYTQSWTNTKQVTSANCRVVVPAAASRANGAFFDVEVTDEITGLAQWAASSIAAEKETHKVTSVKSAQSQIVNGINYKIDFVTRVAIKSSSMLGLYIEDRECSIEIYTQSWTNTKQVTSANCRVVVPAAASVYSAGGFVDTEVTDEIMKMAEWSASTLKTSLETHNVISVKSAQKQVVNGINYKIVFSSVVTVRPSLISFALYIQNRECEVDIYTQSWTNTQKVTASSCKVVA